VSSKSKVPETSSPDFKAKGVSKVSKEGAKSPEASKEGGKASKDSLKAKESSPKVSAHSASKSALKDKEKGKEKGEGKEKESHSKVGTKEPSKSSLKDAPAKESKNKLDPPKGSTGTPSSCPLPPPSGPHSPLGRSMEGKRSVSEITDKRSLSGKRRTIAVVPGSVLGISGPTPATGSSPSAKISAGKVAPSKNQVVDGGKKADSQSLDGTFLSLLLLLLSSSLLLPPSSSSPLPPPSSSSLLLPFLLPLFSLLPCPTCSSAQRDISPNIRKRCLRGPKQKYFRVDLQACRGLEGTIQEEERDCSFW
jgi:hypothetical protein